MRHFKKPQKLPLLGAVGATLIVLLFAYAYGRIFSLSTDVEYLATELASTTRALSETTEHLSGTLSNLDQKTAKISTTLSADIQNTKKSVETVQSQVGGVEQTVGKISGTVTTLEKLSKTDPELLQKYSKVFFLNEHYVPERLVEIPKEYLYIERNPESIHALVWPHLQNLLDDSKIAGVTIYIKSAYRSFDEQENIKSQYTVVYGAGTANQFSADQGYSEHQLGTTADFITTGLGGQLDGFEKTAAYQWMIANAYKYGFALSYPERNGYYIFEPWHWRYVGVKLATYLHEQNKYFYDLDQREIDTYLVSIFD